MDWQHQTTTELATGFGVIVVEDLKIINMIRSAKGAVERPGTNVAQKTGLNRAISQEAWGRTVTLLEYKTADRGGQVVKVGARGTSQTCHQCRHIGPGNRTATVFACKNPPYAAGALVTMQNLAGDSRVDLRFGMDRAGDLFLLSKANGKIWKVTGTR